MFVNIFEFKLKDIKSKHWRPSEQTEKCNQCENQTIDFHEGIKNILKINKLINIDLSKP